MFVALLPLRLPSLLLLLDEEDIILREEEDIILREEDLLLRWWSHLNFPGELNRCALCVELRCVITPVALRHP